jgi:hypothetical protein
MQSPQLEQAAADNSIYVLLHCQLSVKVDTKIPYDRDRHDDVITDRERQVSGRQLS